MTKGARLVELENHIGAECIINGRGDYAMSFRTEIMEKTVFTIEKITKQHKVIIRRGKQTYSIAPKNVTLLSEVKENTDE